MPKPRGLGRGLDALLSQPLAPQPERSPHDKVLHIPIADIDPNREQPRQHFGTEQLEELAQSIRVLGILQPILVMPHGERYTIIAGERRWRAARLAGLTSVPAIARSYDQTQLLEVALIENIQRDNLNPVEEAAAISRLMEECGCTQEQIAVRLGRSRSAVANLVRLLGLQTSVLDMLRDGRLSAGHGRVLAGIESAERQLKLAELAVAGTWSVRQLEVAAQLPEAAERKAKEGRLPEIVDMERMAREVFGTRAQISGGLTRGKLTLSYYSRDDLDRIYEVLEEINRRNEGTGAGKRR